MKKTMKRLIGVVLSMVMILSMSMSVFAASESEVTVNFKYYTQVFGASGVTDTYVGELETIVYVEPGSSVEKAVTDAMDDLGFSYVWKDVPDYYDPTVIHHALDSVTIDGDEYATVVNDTDTQWRGAGWTYSGFDGEDPLNEYNYMDTNKITASEASVDLLYHSYVYDK